MTCHWPWTFATLGDLFWVLCLVSICVVCWVLLGFGWLLLFRLLRFCWLFRWLFALLCFAGLVLCLLRVLTFVL